MSETSLPPELTVTDERIMRIKLRPSFAEDSPRVCLIQIEGAETSTEEVEAKRVELAGSLRWDAQDYDEERFGRRPEGINPKADVRVCGIGGCTVRIFEGLDGKDIQTGECKSADYCLEERFNAVGSAETSEENRALFRDIIDSCESIVGAGSAGNFCPRLNCNLNAGLSEDMVPGTAGACTLKNLLQLEGFEESTRPE